MNIQNTKCKNHHTEYANRICKIQSAKRFTFNMQTKYAKSKMLNISQTYLGVDDVHHTLRYNNSCELPYPVIGTE